MGLDEGSGRIIHKPSYGPEGGRVATAVAVLDWVSMGALAAGAALALAAAANVHRMGRLVTEPRLARLSSFFAGLGLFLVASLAEGLLWTLADPPARDDALGVHDLLFAVRHLAFLLALGAMFLALEGGPRIDKARAPVFATFLLVAEPVLLLVEGLLAVVLMVRAVRVHVRRGNVGSLEVLLGFAFLIASRWLPFVLAADGPAPLGVPHVGTSLALLGATGAFVLAMPRAGGPRGA